MIHVTRINGDDLILNAGLIEFIEATPDTVISMTTGRRIMVKESVLEVVDRVTDYESRVSFETRFGRRHSPEADPQMREERF